MSRPPPHSPPAVDGGSAVRASGGPAASHGCSSGGLPAPRPPSTALRRHPAKAPSNASGRARRWVQRHAQGRVGPSSSRMRAHADVHRMKTTPPGETRGGTSLRSSNRFGPSSAFWVDHPVRFAGRPDLRRARRRPGRRPLRTPIGIVWSHPAANAAVMPPRRSDRRESHQAHRPCGQRLDLPWDHRTPRRGSGLHIAEFRSLCQKASTNDAFTAGGRYGGRPMRQAFPPAARRRERRP